MEDREYTEADFAGLVIPEEERWENLTLANDFMFGHIMRKKSLCLEMMRRILPEKSIEDIRLIEIQKTIREGIDTRGVGLDLFVGGSREVIDTEIQTAMTPDLGPRTRAYHAMMGGDVLNKFKNEGKTYNDMPESYVIFICTFDPFKQGKHVYTFRNFCCEDKNIALADGSTTMFLNAYGQDKADPKMKAFLDFIIGKECEDPFIRELRHELYIAKHSAQWRGEYMRALMERNEITAKGIEIGIAQGERKNQLLTARRMIDGGLDDNTICMYSGLSTEEIRRLRT